MKTSQQYFLEIVRDTRKIERVFSFSDLHWALNTAIKTMFDDDVVAVSLSIKLKEKNGS